MLKKCKRCMHVYAMSLQSCPSLCDPMECSPPGSSVRGIFQEDPPGDLPDSRIEPSSLMPPALASGFFTACAMWEAWKRYNPHLNRNYKAKTSLIKSEHVDRKRRAVIKNQIFQQSDLELIGLYNRER